ncbi:Sulfite exporter TauE/SafE [Legionella massiliensis]|uniref:Probable membrane transporter protein n=1 Tax=Legionella massiliensis TaxID=1034943 RepID=A0A078KX17_9GAMM|nr:sulfite exporter TauE/SafE family protein [Legionella massiliensis]CDZ76314.1 Sulfite exporter TauE/SafE [Legionella massiliensis]CEE12052.1 Sulfite exporter TauE/SafE [Legionella massiliensis]
MLPFVVINGLAYALAGVFAGLSAGLLGVGGGIVVVPTLMFLFQYNHDVAQNLIMPVAIGTSLAVMIFTAYASVRAHQKQKGVQWEIYKRLAVGIILGTITGAFIVKKLPTNEIKIIFALFLLSIAVKMLLSIIKKATTTGHGFPKAWLNHLTSYVIGCLSGLLGIGGGAMVVPYLNHCGLDIREIIPVSAIVTVTVAIIGTLSYIIVGFYTPDLPAYSSGFVYWPAVFCIALTSVFFAPIGARLAYILPTNLLKCCFILLLLAISVKFLMDVWL